jgi:aryl-alcohol dehydrogenase
VAVDLHPHRLDLARELGATHTVDGGAIDVVGQILAICGGGGADHTFDTTGNTTVMANALSALRMGGHAGFVGVQMEPLTLDPTALIGKTVTGILEGSAVPQELIPRLLALWKEGRFPFDRLIETFPLEEINEAEAASLEGRVVKPVLLPGGPAVTA